jgi:L-aspartate oxidase
MRPVVVVGAGIAGLATALQLAPLPVTVVTAGRLRAQTATAWAQGGIAAAVGPDDAPDRHQADTEAAGAGLVDPAIARAVTAIAPTCLADLEALGVPFDRDADGRLALGLEGAHSRPRIAHVGGDGSGVAILNALIEAVQRTPSITLRENTAVSGLVEARDRVEGVRLADGPLMARAVVLATGGSSGLFADTTNPLQAAGRGLAMAARAGAGIVDAEFVQFHPTAMAVGRDPMPLATEALRGEGATLVTAAGEALMAGTPGGDLAARDVIARRIHAAIEAGESVYLDGRAAIGNGFAARYPAVTAACMAAGIDPARSPIPVRPAAHYHMGGIAVDAEGRTAVPGLWAAGEVAGTGLHGANRLASNSLLEGLAFGRWIAAAIKGEGAPRPAGRPPGRSGSRSPKPLSEPPAWLRACMSRAVGAARTADGLEAAIARLGAVAFAADHPARDHALAGLFMAEGALRRRECRGGHWRLDHPRSKASAAVRRTLSLDDLEGQSTSDSYRRVAGSGA